MGQLRTSRPISSRPKVVLLAADPKVAAARPNKTPIPSGAHGVVGDDTGARGPWVASAAFGAGTASPMTIGGFTVDQLGSG